MRNVRSVLLGLGTLIILLTFVGFATFSPDETDSRPETTTEPIAEPLALAADAGSTTGRVTAFVFANQLQAQTQPEIQPVYSIASFAELGREPLPATTTSTTVPPTTTTTTTTTAPRPKVTTTTTPPPPTTTTSTTAPPATTTTTTPSSTPLTEGEMRALATQYFPAAEVEKAVLVARCESNYDPSAYNPRGPFGGLFQHSLAYWDGRAAAAGWGGASIFDPVANTAVTAWLQTRDGWGHWPWCSVWADGQLGG